MRILQVNDFPLQDRGGAEVLLARTIALLRTAGAQVELFTGADLADCRPSARRYLDNAQARRALAERLRAFCPDVVHLHNFYHLLSPGILAELGPGRSPRPRVVMTAHDYHLVCPSAGGIWYERGSGAARAIDPAQVHGPTYLLTRRWDHRGRAYSWLKLFQHAWNYRGHDRRRVPDVVICPSRFLEALVRPVVRATQLLPHPAPPPGYRRPRPALLQLIFVGRVEPEKGLCDFLEAVPPDFGATLVVVGDGSDVPRCQDTCARRRLALHVEFLGRMPHARALAAIAGAHVLVLPSRCLESYGLTLIEALAAGTNVLATDRGAMREMIEDAGVGYLFPPGDATSLAVQLGRIRQAHAAGTLNRFDVSAFLAARSESAYLRGLLQIYQGELRVPAVPLAA